MKKISIMVLVTLFTTSLTGYTQIFKDQDTRQEKTADRNSKPANNRDDVDFYGGFFRSDASNPGTRPDFGEGIGQEAMLECGLSMLITCSIVIGFLKFYKRKRKRESI